MNPTTPEYKPQLDAAANAIDQDDRELLRASIEPVVFETADRLEMWLMQAWSNETLERTEACISRALEMDDSHPIALAGLAWVRGVKQLAADQWAAKQQAEDAARPASRRRSPTAS